MKWLNWFFAAFVAAILASGSAVAQDKGKAHTSAEVKKDIDNHRAMADAHLAAAKCLESAKGEKVCHEQLARDCKGLGIGKICGMQHRH